MDDLKIEYLSPYDVFPYPGNPRDNDEAVPALAESIKAFGFKVPVIVDRDNVIVCGHTRVKAARALDMTRIPVIRADDLTPEQVAAFRLADNKVAEQAKWDPGVLKIELGNVAGSFDMHTFGFTATDLIIPDTITLAPLKPPKQDPHPEAEPSTDDDAEVGEDTPAGDEGLDEDQDGAPDYEDDGGYIDYYAYHNMRLFDSDTLVPPWDIPMLDPVDHVPVRMVGFHDACVSADPGACIHFFESDYKFEQIWRSPEKYIELLSRFDSVLAPNFSTFGDMPAAMQAWNRFRSQAFAQACQRAGLTVIPVVQRVYGALSDLSFAGIPQRSTIAISTIGKHNVSAADKAEYGVWLDEVIERLQPQRILLYGVDIDYDFGSIEVKRYKNEITMRARKRAAANKAKHQKDGR